MDLKHPQTHPKYDFLDFQIELYIGNAKFIFRVYSGNFSESLKYLAINPKYGFYDFFGIQPNNMV